MIPRGRPKLVPVYCGRRVGMRRARAGRNDDLLVIPEQPLCSAANVKAEDLT